MKPFRLMQLFRHFTSNAVCPNCGSSLFPECIRVEASLNESAFLTIHCIECDRNMSAHVFINLADQDRVLGVEKEHADISSEELEKARVILRNFEGGVSDLFAKRI